MFNTFNTPVALATGMGDPTARWPSEPSSVHATSTVEPWLRQLLDELDYGVVLLQGSAQVVYLNHAARSEFHLGRCVELADGVLKSASTADARTLSEALSAATVRGLRRFVMLGTQQPRLTVALIPMAAPLPGIASLTLAIFGRRRLCELMSVQSFARANRLTPAECRVLEQLCEGLDTDEIAEANEVAMSTVRTQVNSIREKTGAASIRHLLQQVALLPPLVSALRA